MDLLNYLLKMVGATWTEGFL